MLPPFKPLLSQFEALSYIVEDPEPYAKYGFSLSCRLDITLITDPGPVAYIEVISKEKGIKMYISINLDLLLSFDFEVLQCDYTN